ncbi:MAG: TonB-dependent receptor, partial [Deltaproteobacteria bacterium]|nr:TonB-dependent receptor [Deltaproteobacteria bacterium]
GEVRGPIETMEVIEGSEESLIWYGGVYASCSFKPTDNMVLTGGLRAEGYYGNLTSDWTIMPRLSYKFEPWSGTIFKAGVGLYQQAPTEDELSKTMGNPKLVMERAWHYSLGFEQELPFNSHLDLNVFYKEMDRLVSTDPDDNYLNNGLGHAVGMEVMLRRNLADVLFGWLAYTLMRSERKDRVSDPWRLFDHDQTHILTLVAGYRLPTGPVMPNHGLRDGWEFGLRFQLVSGNPHTPMIDSVYDADYDVYVPTAGITNSERLPLFHQLDLRVDYTWAFTTWALSLYLDVQNVYNHQNVEGVKYNYDYTEKSYYTGLPIIPALGIKGSF